MRELRRKLITFYFISSAVILGGILFLVCVLFYQNRMAQEKTAVPVKLESLAENIRQKSVISDYELAQTELQEESAILIETGGYLHFDGAYRTGEARKQLLAAVKQLGAEEGEGITGRVEDINYQICYTRIPEYEVGIYWCKDLSGVTGQIFMFWGAIGLAYMTGLVLLYIMSRVLAEKALRPVKENQEKQMDFFHAASHELRSPIAVIKLNNSAALANPGEAREYEETIKRECLRMERLVDDLLLVSTGSLKTWNLKMQREDMDTLLIRVFEKFQPVMMQAKMPLTIELPDDAVRCVVDAYRLEQVMDILLNNALQYACTQKGLELKLAQNRKDVYIHVTDHGPGIPVEERQKIFERFYRMDKSRSDKEHFGLGLSIAGELVTAMRGRIQIDNTPGGGSTFTLIFPKKDK